jgi:crossover junction endodeoxyribonuclease RuvC
VFVLGIDPGLSRCGYCVLDAPGPRARDRSARPVALGVIRTPSDAPVHLRLAELQQELRALLAEYRPSVLAVERVLFQVNVRTAMSVGQASGLALVVAERAGVPIGQYTPNEVKQAVAGYGAADKAQVQAMVARLLHLPEIPQPPDAADALALAICHLSAGRFRAAARQQFPEGAAGGPGSNSPTPVPGLARAIAAATARERR